MRRLKASFAALVLCLSPLTGLAAVDDDEIMAKKPPKLLSAFGFFTDMAGMQPDPSVIPYEVTSPLFTDYADKARWVYAPSPAPYDTDGPLALPVGSALIKTFHYGDHKVETRVLLHTENGWKAYPYVWNEDGTDARLKVAGKNLVVETEAYGTVNYRVPNVNQCKSCHVDAAKNFLPIGPKVRNLNKSDQLKQLVAAGVLAETRSDAPMVPDYRDESVPLDTRARAYLDSNCAHCHGPGLPADTSGLYLNWEEDRPVHRGINKKPVAAGRGSGGLKVDIAPGDPDASIVVFRLDSTDPGVMMPEIGRSLIHREGVALIRAYIEAMD